MLYTIPLPSPLVSLVGYWVITHPIGGGKVLDFFVCDFGCSYNVCGCSNHVSPQSPHAIMLRGKGIVTRCCKIYLYYLPQALLWATGSYPCH